MLTCAGVRRSGPPPGPSSRRRPPPCSNRRFRLKNFRQRFPPSVPLKVREVKAKHKEIAAYALARLVIAADGAGCPITVIEHLIDNHTDGAYEVMRFTVNCPAVPQILSVKYTLFFDVDPQHRGLLRLEDQAALILRFSARTTKP